MVRSGSSRLSELAIARRFISKGSDYPSHPEVAGAGNFIALAIAMKFRTSTSRFAGRSWVVPASCPHRIRPSVLPTPGSIRISMPSPRIC